MSSKVLPAQSSPNQQAVRAEAPSWRQAGVAPNAAPRAESEESHAVNQEAEQLRGRIAELEARIPGEVERARSEVRQAAATEAARSETALRDEHSRRLASAVADLTAVRSQMRRQMEEDLVRLAVVVARRIVRRELAVDPEALVGIAHAAIEQIEAREIHRLQVAPKEVDLMKRLLSEKGLPSRINIVGDPGLETGSLVFETARGTIDASVEVQLAEIDRGLADVVRRSC